MRKIPGLNNTQKIRVIVDGVAIYTTVGKAVGIFATTTHAVAVQKVLESLVAFRKHSPEMTGMAKRETVWVGLKTPAYREVDVQVDLL